MITDVREDRLIVTSDVHLGNLLSRSRAPFLDFLNAAADAGFNLCINGDGIDLAQLSLIRLTRDLGRFSDVLRRFAARDLRVHYVVGNHDIVLEHFLHDWGGLNVVPFLNVESGSRRIRVEHGHIYDDMFVKHPGVYHACTAVGGWCLTISPGLYHLLKSATDRMVRLLTRRRPGVGSAGTGSVDRIVGEPSSFLEAAMEIAARGFDAVVFGHTHLPGEVRLPNGAVYYNTGSWFFEPRYVEILAGETRLLPVAAS